MRTVIGNLSELSDESKNCMYYLMHCLANLRSVVVFRVLTLIHISDLNRLIMDYLVIEGYKTSAEEFSQEAGLSPPVDFESIEGRMNIREALQRGDVEDAITRVNDLNPEVCTYFRLTLAWKGEMIIPLHAPRSAPSGSVMRLDTKTSVFNMIIFSGFHFRRMDLPLLIG